MTATIVGSMELLKLRVYETETGDMAVEPGTYPLVRQPSGHYSVMLRGRPSRREMRTERLGPGLFAMRCNDAVRGPEWEFPHGYWTAAEFAELLKDPVALEGHPDQRLRFHLVGAV